MKLGVPMSPDQPADPADEELLAALVRASGTVPEAVRQSVYDAFGLFDQAEGGGAEGAR
jgi:hypothetical protein